MTKSKTSLPTARTRRVRGSQQEIEAKARALAEESKLPVTVRYRDNPTGLLGVIFFPDDQAKTQHGFFGITPVGPLPASPA